MQNTPNGHGAAMTSNEFELVMRSAVSSMNDIQYGRFQHRDQAEAVGALLLAADAKDAPEWGRFDVIPVLALPDASALGGSGPRQDPGTVAASDAMARRRLGWEGTGLAEIVEEGFWPLLAVAFLAAAMFLTSVMDLHAPLLILIAVVSVPLSGLAVGVNAPPPRWISNLLCNGRGE